MGLFDKLVGAAASGVNSADLEWAECKKAMRGDEAALDWVEMHEQNGMSNYANKPSQNEEHKGQTPLMIAARGGQVRAVNAFIFVGGNVNDTNVHDNNKTPLMYAATAGVRTGNNALTPKIIDRLVEGGANINAVDAQGKTALMYAAEVGHYDSVKALVENGANVEFDFPKDMKDVDKRRVETAIEDGRYALGVKIRQERMAALMSGNIKKALMGGGKITELKDKQNKVVLAQAQGFKKSPKNIGRG